MTKDERTNGETCYELEVPGFEQSMLQVDYYNGYFTVYGKRENCAGKHIEVRHRLEIGVNRKITASFDNGLITLLVR